MAKSKMTKCFCIKAKSIVDISAKCLKVSDYNGNEELIPKSQVYGFSDGGNTQSIWIAAWLVEKRSLNYSTKKEGWFDASGNNYCSVTEKIIPEEVMPSEVEEITELLRDD